MEEVYQDQEQQLISFALAGREAQQFEDSRFGQYMREMIDGKEEAALEEYRNVDPEDPKEIRRLQNELKVCELFRDFVKCAIEGGRAAEMEIESMNTVD